MCVCVCIFCQKLGLHSSDCLFLGHLFCSLGLLICFMLVSDCLCHYGSVVYIEARDYDTSVHVISRIILAFSGLI